MRSKTDSLNLTPVANLPMIYKSFPITLNNVMRTASITYVTWFWLSSTEIKIALFLSLVAVIDLK